MSIPDNLVTTPVELLEPESEQDDVYVDNERWKFKFQKKAYKLGSTKIHPYSIMSNNSVEDNLAKAKALNKIKPADLELKFNKDETTPLTPSDASEKMEQSHATTDIEQTTKKLEETSHTPGITAEKVPTTVSLSLHDQLARSLERQMQIIENYEKARQLNKDDEETAFLTAVEGLLEKNTIQNVENTTHYLVKNISEFVDKYKDATKVLSLSQELLEHERIVQSMQKIVDENPTELPALDKKHENRIINTANMRYQFEMTGSKEKEQLVSTISMLDRVNDIHECMDRQKHLHDVELTTPSNDQPRLQKRSIPNTNPELLKNDQEDTTTKDESTISERRKESSEFVNNMFPGPDNFWNVFVTSPVEVILNTTNSYEKSHERGYYEKLVKSLRETTQSHVHHSISYGSTEQRQSHLGGTQLHTEQTKSHKFAYSKELAELMGHIENPTSLEIGIAKKLLEKNKGSTTLDPREKLSPEKYAHYIQLKQSLDEQYNEIRGHMNKTNQDIQRLFIEMRNLREEKALNDYFEDNEKYYSHLSTPANYTESILFLEGSLTTPPMNYFEWENASDFMPDETNAPDEKNENVLKHELLEDLSSFVIQTEPPDEHFDAHLQELYHITTPSTTTISDMHYNPTSKNTEKYDYESLERYDKKNYKKIHEMEMKEDGAILPNISASHLELVHANIMSRLNKSANTQKIHKSSVKIITTTPKLWFEESVFDQNDPKILYAKYLHNVRNMTVRLNMEVGKKQIRNITFFKEEERRYAHQFKTTTECRRFSHIIPFWLTQPKEIEEVFQGNTKIFREYIQYILDKHNFTELPVHGRFAFVRNYINKLNNPLILNRITIFPTAYATTDHVLTLKEQFKQFKGHVKSKVHRAYKHMKHFLFNSSLDEVHDPVTIGRTDAIPDEVIINITTQPPLGDYYYNNYDN